MTIKSVYKVFALIALAILLQGRSGGPGTVASFEVTGAPGSVGSAGTCGNNGCHTSGAFDPVMMLTLTDEITSEPVTNYIPGNQYLLEIEFMTSTTPAATGFQAVALDGTDSNAGTWSDITAGIQEVTLSARNYLEHSSPSDGATSWSMQWTAPAEGTGDVTFYSAGIASNLNGSTAGDGVASNNLSISEMDVSSTDQFNNLATMLVAPNPVLDNANLLIESQQSGVFQLNLLSVTGQLVHSEKIQLQSGQNENNLDMTDLQSGVYFLQLRGERQMSTQQIVKL